jgi:protein O-mannosyl-transferase
MSNIRAAHKSRSQAPFDPKPRFRQWGIPLLIAACAVIAFYPVLQNGFVNWDDDQNLLENPFYRGLHWTNIRWMFTTFHMGHYQPFSWLTFSLDYLLWGMDPFGYHLTNLILHAANGMLVYFVALRLLVMAAPISNPTMLQLAAGFSALVFAIHPLRVESVAWATERRDVLSGFFLLLTVISYLKAVGPEISRTGWRRWIAVAASLYVLSLLAKASGMTLPLVLLILDVYPLRRLGQPSTGWFGPRTRNVWREKIPFFVLALGAGAIALVAQYQSGAIRALEQHGTASRLGQSLYGLVFYLWKTILPLNLSPLYEIGGDLEPWQGRFLIAGCIVLTISLVLCVLRRRWPAVLASWLSYVIILAPTLGFAQSGPQLVADRYTYVACLSWAILAGGGILYLKRRWNKGGIVSGSLALASACSLIILAYFGVLTWRQTQIWKDSERLWRHALSIQKESIFAHNNLGMALAEQDKLDEAIAEFREVLRIDPEDADGRHNLGNALARKGRLGEAIVQFHEALRIHPGYAKAHYDLGNALARQGELDSAVVHLRQALRYAPRDASAHYNAGRILLEQRKLEEATDHFRQALRIDATHVKARYYLAVTLVGQGDVEGAGKEFQETLRIEPNLAEAHAGLARALSAQGKKDEAVQHYQEAVRILQSQKPTPLSR